MSIGLILSAITRHTLQPSLFPDTPSRLFETPIEQHSSETGPPDTEPEVLMHDLREENERLKEEKDKLDHEYHHLVLRTTNFQRISNFTKTKLKWSKRHIRH